MSIPGCETFRYLLSDYISAEENSVDDSSKCVVDKGQLGIFYGLTDFLAVIILLFAVGWLKEFEAAEIDDLDRNTVDPAFLRFMCHGYHSTENDLRKYFARETPADTNICRKTRKIESKSV